MFYREVSDDPLQRSPTLGAKVYAELEATPERYLVYAGHAIKQLQRELSEAPTFKGYIRHKWRQIKTLFHKDEENWYLA